MKGKRTNGQNDLIISRILIGTIWDFVPGIVRPSNMQYMLADWEVWQLNLELLLLGGEEKKKNDEKQF